MNDDSMLSVTKKPQDTERQNRLSAGETQGDDNENNENGCGQERRNRIDERMRDVEGMFQTQSARIRESHQIEIEDQHPELREQSIVKTEVPVYILLDDGRGRVDPEIQKDDTR